MLTEAQQAVAVLIPTLDNRLYLEPCLRSLRATTNAHLTRVFVLNNGEPGSCDWCVGYGAMVADLGGNIGWEGALKAGVSLTAEPNILCLNDDTFFPPSSQGWLARMVHRFEDQRVGAVGPSSNYVAGAQTIWAPIDWRCASVAFLCGFCLLVRRAALIAAGGIDLSQSGADDRDLSIRLVDAGYLLLADRGVFVYHHGAVTGAKVYGSVWGDDGWYGKDTLAGHRARLVTKHGEQRVVAQERTMPVPYPPLGTKG
jgi:GT2 family glycosyltransferase